jgi:hypothetical protein
MLTVFVHVEVGNLLAALVVVHDNLHCVQVSLVGDKAFSKKQLRNYERKLLPTDFSVIDCVKNKINYCLIPGNPSRDYKNLIAIICIQQQLPNDCLFIFKLILGLN